MSEQWVCSRWNTQPKDSEKWLVTGETFYEWLINPRVEHCSSHFVPKSDYIPCQAPEQWEPVEVRMIGCNSGDGILIVSPCDDKVGGVIGTINFHSPGYRVRSLVVERRKG